MQSYLFWTKHIFTFSLPIFIAFNLMRPRVLAHKLIYDFNLGNQLVACIVDFLSCRCHCVFVNGKCSDMRLTHTGLPQGCCLLPLLYTLYTDSCRSARADRFLVKFDGDGALLYTLLHNKTTVQHYDILWSDVMTPV